MSDLWAIGEEAALNAAKLKGPTVDRFFVYTAMLTKPEAVNLASKLLQFATQEGTK